MSGRSFSLVPACIAVALGGCSKKSDEAPVPVGSAVAPVADAAKPAAPADPNAVCTVVSRETWGRYPNRLTGLTLAQLGERAAVGFALGNQAHVLVVEKGGEAALVRAAASAGSLLAKDLPAGRRELQRVTPGVSGGRVVAYADHRDALDEGRRRVACGRVDGDALVAFEGKPLIEEKKKKPAEQAAAAEAPATPAAAPETVAQEPAASPPPAEPAPESQVGVRPQSIRNLGRIARALRGLRDASTAPPQAEASPPPAAPEAPAPTAAPPPPPATPAPTAPAGKTDALREVRDCRSFVDAKGESPWAAGSELVGERKPNGSTAYSLVFFADPGAGRERVSLRTIALPAEPGVIPTFEAATAQQLKDGSWVLAARQQSTLYAWVLGADKRPRRPMHTYKGGYPTMPRFLADGMDHLFVLSQKVEAERFELFFGRIDPHQLKLPATLSRPALALQGTSAAMPALARAGDQRWLSYQAGDRRKASLMLVPVDANLAPTGAAHAVVPAETGVHESLLIGLPGGRLLAVYIKSGEPTELVSELLSCQVRT